MPMQLFNQSFLINFCFLRPLLQKEQAVNEGGTEPAVQFIAEESDPEKFDHLEHEAAAKKRWK